MISIFRWILGYVRFSFNGGFPEDFLTDCFSQDLKIRDVTLSDDGFVAYCDIKTYTQLHKYAFKHGGRVRVLKKYGLPFITFPLKNRWGFFAGAFAFAVLLSLLSSFVWNIEIVGNNRISDTTLYTYLEKHNLKRAVMWSSVDRQKICWDMMSDFDDISWAHINKNGTTARLEINETRLADKDGDQEKLQGINVFRRELVAVVSREQKDITIKDIREYKRLNFFWLNIPLYANRKKGDMTKENTQFVEIKGVTLPVSVEHYQEYFLNSKAKTLNDSELLSIAKRKLAAQQERELDGFEIINKTESYTIDDDKCVLSCWYIIRRK